jgi:hypothetical protein
LNVTALRVDARHDVFDGAVLAGGVEGLEHHQQRRGIGRVEQFLGGPQLVLERSEVVVSQVTWTGFAGVASPVGPGFGGIPAVQVGRFAGLHHQLLDDLVVEFHVSTLHGDPGGARTLDPGSLTGGSWLGRRFLGDGSAARFGDGALPRAGAPDRRPAPDLYRYGVVVAPVAEA